MSRIKGPKCFYHSWIYDRNVIPPGTTTTRSLFFAVPKRDGDPEKNFPGKGPSDTNMDVGGQLTGVNSFQVKAMEVLVKTSSPDSGILKRASFTLIVNSVPIPDPLPLEVLMARKLEFEDGLITIDPGDTFSVEIQFDGGITPEFPIEILFILWGIRCKPMMMFEEKADKKGRKKVLLRN